MSASVAEVILVRFLSNRGTVWSYVYLATLSDFRSDKALTPQSSVTQDHLRVAEEVASG